MSSEEASMQVTLSIQVPVQQQPHMMRWLATLNDRAPDCFSGCRFQIDVSYNLDITQCKEMRPPRLSRKSGEKPKGKKRRDEQDSGDQSNLTSQEGSSDSDATNTAIQTKKEHSNSVSENNPELAKLPKDPRFFRSYEKVRKNMSRFPKLRAEYCYVEKSGRSPYPRLRGKPDGYSQFKGFYNISHENWYQSRVQTAPETEGKTRPSETKTVEDAPSSSQSECMEDRAVDTGHNHTENDIMTPEFVKQLQEADENDKQCRAKSEQDKLLDEIINFDATVKTGSKTKRKKASPRDG